MKRSRDRQVVSLLVRIPPGTLRRSCGFGLTDSMETEGAADSKIHCQRTCSPAKVARHYPFAKCWHQIEITVLRAPNKWRRAIRIRTGEARPVGKLTVQIRVDTGNDIKGSARTGHYQGREDQLPEFWVAVVAEQRESMAHVIRRWPPFTLKVV